jgi:hypothetical protein
MKAICAAAAGEPQTLARLSEMPPRTNEFQQLIVAVQSHLDPGSTVVESAMLRDVHTGSKREVDIVVSGRVGAQAVTVSIECRDRARPSDVTWVDEMKTKHSRLPTNVLVLVSHSPFTREARAVASQYGIRCLELSDTDPEAPDRLFPDVSSLWGKGWQLKIERVEISVPATGALPGEWFKAQPDTSLFLEDGAFFASAGDFVMALIKSNIVIDKMYQDAAPEHAYLELVLEPPRIGTSTVSVQKQEPLLIRPIERMRVVAKCLVTVDEFPLRHGIFGDVRIAWGRGAILGNPTLLVATAGLDSRPKLTMRVQGHEFTAG